jgi:hypothetical protein
MRERLSLLTTADADAVRVSVAAEHLGVREIDLFRLAWHRWYGDRGSDRVIENAFVAYMFRHEVPPWVRQFVRTVLADAARGRLQPQPYGVIPRRREPPLRWPGAVYVGIVLAVTVLFVVVLAATPGSGDATAALFCHGGDGLRHYARLAYAIAASPPPGCL